MTLLIKGNLSATSIPKLRSFVVDNVRISSVTMKCGVKQNISPTVTANNITVILRSQADVDVDSDTLCFDRAPALFYCDV